jgi:hypothetical protein
MLRTKDSEHNTNWTIMQQEATIDLVMNLFISAPACLRCSQFFLSLSDIFV